MSEDKSRCSDPELILAAARGGGQPSVLTPVRSLKFTRPIWVLAVRLCAGLLLVGYTVMFASVWDKVGLDWREYFYPYTQAALHGQNPYALHVGLFVPWVLALTAPFAVLPERLGVPVFFAFTLASYAFIAHKMGAKETALVAFMFSPPVSTGLLLLNVDIFVLWGFILPPPLAVLFLLIKPQVGGVFAAYLLLQAWHTGGIRKFLVTVTPTTIALVLSFLLFGNWVAVQFATGSTLTQQYWNTSLFPFSLVVGVPLLVMALWKRRQRAAISATLLCSPYLSLPSWGAALLACLPSDALTVAVVAVTMLLRVTLWRGL